MTLPLAKQTRSAASIHDAMAAAWTAQQDALAGEGRDVWGNCAQSFKADPRRPLDALLTKIASFLQPADTLIDIGGGAGRLSLPLAARCREVIVIDPSPAMGEVFDAALADSGITNARFVAGTWPVDAPEGNVALIAHVTYFVPQIVPFIETLRASIRRRVIVCVRSVPPPNQMAPFFSLVYDEPYALVPRHEELLAVLQELAIPAELIDVGPATVSATALIRKTRREAIEGEVEAAQKMGWLGKVPPERLAQEIERHFDELLVETDLGYQRRSIIGARDLLITWKTA